MALARAFGCARVVFNDGLRARREAHAAGLAYITDTDLQRRVEAGTHPDGQPTAAGIPVPQGGEDVKP
jgi:putative transposase